MATLEEALPHGHLITAVGLDSTSGDIRRHSSKTCSGALARRASSPSPTPRGRPTGVHLAGSGPVAGPTGRSRGQVLRGPALVQRLRDDRVPLTVCPLSNVMLGCSGLANHNLATCSAPGWSLPSTRTIPRTSAATSPTISSGRPGTRPRPRRDTHPGTSLVRVSFLAEADKVERLAEVDRYAATNPGAERHASMARSAATRQASRRHRHPAQGRILVGCLAGGRPPTSYPASRQDG